MIKGIRDDIKNLKPYTISEEMPQIKLDANESPFNFFEDLKEDFLKKIEKLEINRYPQINSGNLCSRIGKMLKLKKENIICGNGSDELIQVVINTFVDKDDLVITHSPTFSMYKVATQIAGGRLIEIESDEEFNIDEDKIIKVSNEKEAKLIILCNPNNPTGTVTKRDTILKIIENTSAMIIIDEAYYEFLDESMIDKIENGRIIVLRTLSKAFGLAGARLGYGIAKEELINLFMKVKPPYNVNILSEALADLYIDNKNKIDEGVKEILKEKEYLLNNLQELEKIKIYPSGSNFILIKSDRAEKIIEACQKEGVSLRSFSNKRLKDHIRISIGKREENDKLLKILERVV